ncbi:MAG: tRNA uridine-5-carboxymethylaminomethyl(34) synthesis GTPase MnmE [Crocinitomicaceae bacterium]
MNNTNDTICALATPNGVGAIAMIRLSGSHAKAIVQRCFSKSIGDKPSHTCHFGNFHAENGDIVDEVLVTVFDHGKSFTGEESVEISCHASPFIQKKILETLLNAGARLAHPGEFTMRAFANGKMDLSQAEAVADLIASESRNAHNIALKQLKGGFSTELKELREKLIHFASLVELELDFAEEDVEFADRKELNLLVSEVLLYIQRLAKSFELGNAIKNGVPVAIVGAPNTGKSTLLNQLLGEDRAIVSDIAGTTRDVIEEQLNIDGIQFRLIDTAGIREGAETIEALGIERSKAKIVQASIVLCLADSSIENNLQDVYEWAKEIRATHPDKKIVLVANKADLSEKTIENCEFPIVSVSAKFGFGIEAMKETLVETVVADFDIANETIVSNVRHYDALLRTQADLEKAKYALETNVTGDFVALDLRQAMYHLGTITGQISEDDLLANIFAKFCIGK